MLPGTWLRAFEGRRDDFVDGAQFAAQIHLSRINARQLRQAFDEPVKAVGFLIDDLQQFFPTFVAERRARLVPLKRVQL